MRPIGRMVLNRNPDNFFAETEQVAFCTAHIVPGLDFSNDPLLAGRIHSYVDTQITRLGGPNFHEIPINAPVAQVHNNQRDGMHRQAIPRGRVAYEPNSLGGGCPFQAGRCGFHVVPAAESRRTRCAASREKFAEHYTQATLFWNSQTAVEKPHIIRAFRFELTKVQTTAVRKRVVAQLRNVAEELAQAVADGIGLTDLPEALPNLMKSPAKPEVRSSDALSLMSRPGQASIATRRIALLVADGVEGSHVRQVQQQLAAQGAVARVVGIKLGAVRTDGGPALEIEVSMETAPSVIWDAVVVFDTADKLHPLAASGHALEFLKDQYRHCKPMMVVGTAKALLDAAGIPAALPSKKPDPGILVASSSKGGVSTLPAFVKSVAKHRHFERETDPPRV